MLSRLTQPAQNTDLFINLYTHSFTFSLSMFFLLIPSPTPLPFPKLLPLFVSRAISSPLKKLRNSQSGNDAPLILTIPSLRLSTSKFTHFLLVQRNGYSPLLRSVLFIISSDTLSWGGSLAGFLGQ